MQSPAALWVSPKTLANSCERSGANETLVVRSTQLPPRPYRPLWQSRRGRILGPLWIFHSQRARRIVRLRGNIVYYAWLLLESDPDVVELCEQPFAVRVKVDGRWVLAVVDIWVRLRDGREYFVVAAYRNHLAGSQQSAATKRRVRALTEWAKQGGTALVVMPHTVIWRHPQLLSNWSHILRFLREENREAELDFGGLVLRAMTARGRMTLGEFESSFTRHEPTLVRAAVFRLLVAGALRADLREDRLGANTEFSLP